MQHVRNVHERVGQVVCHICAKVYSSKVSLRTHLLEHNDAPQPRVTCEICGNTFKSEQNRLKHVKRHQETGVACPRCGKMSPNRNALKTHIAYVHSAKKTLQCHFCDKKFKRRIALTVSALDTGDRPSSRCASFISRLVHSHRNMWQRTPEKICTVASTARRDLNIIPACICIIGVFIQSNGRSIAKQRKPNPSLIHEIKPYYDLDFQ